MNADTLRRACLELSRMESRTPWSPDQAALYESGLNPFPDYVVSDLIYRALHVFDERPSVSVLIRMAAELMNKPIPTPTAAWEEVESLIVSRGIYCDPDPFKPNIFREGEPHFSHPLIGRTIKQMGGWTAVCTNDRGSDYLRERFRGLYNDLVGQFTRESENVKLVEPGQPMPARGRRRVAVARK